jgi:predicted small metal-binding protein
MRVLECNVCGETVTAASDEELVLQLRSHFESQHASAEIDDEKARELIESEAYDASDS